jgi:hypothetical protein
VSSPLVIDKYLIFSRGTLEEWMSYMAAAGGSPTTDGVEM